MRKFTDMKLLIGIFLCAGFAAIFTGAIVFFLHSYSANQEMRVEETKTIKLSTVAGILDKSDIVLCAHRGFSAVAPENTVAAITAAGDAGFLYVEFDVQETSDGMLVLMHDKKLNKMTNGKGRLSFYTFKELLSFNIDNGANYKKYGVSKIPTLNQAMSTCYEYGMTPVIEMKSISVKGVQKLADELADFSFSKAIVASFDQQKIIEFREINKDAELWLFSSELSEKAIQFCVDNRGVVLSFNAAKVDDTNVVCDIAKKGIKMNCWTVNDIVTLRKFYDCGIRSFTTNNIIPLQIIQ